MTVILRAVTAVRRHVVGAVQLRPRKAHCYSTVWAWPIYPNASWSKICVALKVENLAYAFSAYSDIFGNAGHVSVFATLHRSNDTLGGQVVWSQAAETPIFTGRTTPAETRAIASAVDTWKWSCPDLFDVRIAIRPRLSIIWPAEAFGCFPRVVCHFEQIVTHPWPGEQRIRLVAPLAG